MKNQQQLFVYDYLHETEPNPFNAQERVWKACVILKVTVFSGSVRLNGIRSVDRGRGNAGMALQWLCDLALKYNVTLTLYVRPFGDQRPRTQCVATVCMVQAIWLCAESRLHQQT